MGKNNYGIRKAGIIKKNLQRCVSPIIKQFYGGIGSILMFHRIAGGLPGPRLEECRNLLETPPRVLEETISYLRRKRYTFVNMDEVFNILNNNRSCPKFAVITIDDGYRDTYDVAYPMLTQMGVPFTLYLATGVPQKTLIPWTYLLERALLERSTIQYSYKEKYYKYVIRDQKERVKTFWTLIELFENLSTIDRQIISKQIFGEEAVREMKESLELSWDHVKEMATSPLVTIGAHTVNHLNLSALGREEAYDEILEPKRQIENRIKQKVDHCSYPFGSSTCCGLREFQLTREAGYKTATTTRLANIFPEHKNGLHCLPRVYGENLEGISLALKGSISAFRYRGRRIVME